jgi:protein involved in polysaccharide export with SLBB domain
LEQRKHLDEAISEMDRSLQIRESNVVSGSTPEDQAFAQQQLQQAHAAVDRLRSAEPTGRIVLDLKPTDTDLSALPRLALEDGDHLFIPPAPPTVEVVGAVYSPSTFLFQDGESMRRYLRQAGGALRDADDGRVFIIRANGAVMSRQSHRSIWMGDFESLQLLPGDVVVMPQRIKTTTALREIRDWSEVFSQFALGAAAVKIIGQ